MEISDEKIEIKFEVYSGLFDKFVSGVRVFVASGLLEMVADAVALESEEAGSSTLRSKVGVFGTAVFSSKFIWKRDVWWE